MMRYAVFVALVALSLQASARRIQSEKILHSRSIGDNEIDVSDDIEVKSFWHGQADKGFPEFDGNPVKQSLAIATTMLSTFGRKIFKGVEDYPLILKTIFQDGATTEWKNFDELLDFLGTAQIAIQEAVENNQKADIDISEYSELKKLWHGHVDKGYPYFDGNPFKQLVVEITTWLSRVARDFVKYEKDVPLIIKQFLKSAQKTNWDSFEEYLHFWGTALKTMKNYLDHYQQ